MKSRGISLKMGSKISIIMTSLGVNVSPLLSPTVTIGLDIGEVVMSGVFGMCDMLVGEMHISSI